MLLIQAWVSYRMIDLPMNDSALAADYSRFAHWKYFTHGSGSELFARNMSLWLAQAASILSTVLRSAPVADSFCRRLNITALVAWSSQGCSVMLIANSS